MASQKIYMCCPQTPRESAQVPPPHAPKMTPAVFEEHYKTAGMAPYNIFGYLVGTDTVASAEYAEYVPSGYSARTRYVYVLPASTVLSK